MPTENRSSNTEMVSVPREHELKIRQTPLADLLSGLKTGEIRDCSDREFAVGDTVLLREIDDAREYTGTVLRRTITHVQKNYGLPDHLCVLSYGQPAEQHQGEPVAYLCKAEGAKWLQYGSRVGDPWKHGEVQVTPLYPHADPGEVERLVAANTEYARRHLERLDEVERLRAALKFYADREHFHFESGKWDTVSGEPLNILWCDDEPDFIEDGSVARAALERKL